MRNKIYVLLFIFYSALMATDIEIKSGKIFSGKIIKETDNQIILHIQGSDIPIYKNVILKIDGQLYETGKKVSSGNKATIEENTDSNKDYKKTETVKDIDGNVYNTIRIGNQVWTVENLRTTKFNDGTPIPLVTSNNKWKRKNTKPKYCWYDNKIGNKDKYGALYNWYAVNTGKLAPKGWHVPTEDEWYMLTKYLAENGYNWDGTIEKNWESVTIHKLNVSKQGDYGNFDLLSKKSSIPTLEMQVSKNENKIGRSIASKTDWVNKFGVTIEGGVGNRPSLNNSSGFSALPSGHRETLYGIFECLGEETSWWSVSEANILGWVSCATLTVINPRFAYNGGAEKTNGLSVRLVKD